MQLTSNFANIQLLTDDIFDEEQLEWKSIEGSNIERSFYVLSLKRDMKLNDGFNIKSYHLLEAIEHITGSGLDILSSTKDESLLPDKYDTLQKLLKKLKSSKREASGPNDDESTESYSIVYAKKTRRFLKKKQSATHSEYVPPVLETAKVLDIQWRRDRFVLGNESESTASVMYGRIVQPNCFFC